MTKNIHTRMVPFLAGALVACGALWVAQGGEAKASTTALDQATITAMQTAIQELQFRLAHVRRSGDELFITGANVHIRNGLGATSLKNAKGNLIVGYNENYSYATRSGSHNVVLGRSNSYTGSGSIVSGVYNTAGADDTAVLGGQGNIVSKATAGSLGGLYNDVSGYYAAAVGGYRNTVTGASASAQAGSYNTVGGSCSAATGGRANLVSGSEAAATAGYINTVTGQGGVALGGSQNTVSGHRGAGVAGARNETGGSEAAAVAGLYNKAAAPLAATLGGSYLEATGYAEADLP